MRRTAAILLLVSALAPREAGAFLQTGTLLTSMASATFQNWGLGTSVTYSATSKLIVQNPSINVSKDATPTTVAAATGGLITYTISFSNGGFSTAFYVTLNDALPNSDGVWFQGIVSKWSSVGLPAGSWSTNGVAWWPGEPPTGQQGPVRLRWIVPSLSIGASGIITYVVSFG